MKMYQKYIAQQRKNTRVILVSQNNKENLIKTK